MAKVRSRMRRLNRNPRRRMTRTTCRSDFMALWQTAFPDQVDARRPRAALTAKPRKPIRRRSAKMRGLMDIYRERKAAYLKKHPWCAVVPHDGRQRNRATEIHHTRGRAGTLLLDERYWLPVSASGHDFIHANPKLARELGYLCQPGEWNKTDNDESDLSRK